MVGVVDVNAVPGEDGEETPVVAVFRHELEEAGELLLFLGALGQFVLEGAGPDDHAGLVSTLQDGHWLVELVPGEDVGAKLRGIGLVCLPQSRGRDEERSVDGPLQAAEEGLHSLVHVHVVPFDLFLFG